MSRKRKNKGNAVNSKIVEGSLVQLVYPYEPRNDSFFYTLYTVMLIEGKKSAYRPMGYIRGRLGVPILVVAKAHYSGTSNEYVFSGPGGVVYIGLLGEELVAIPANYVVKWNANPKSP